MITLIISISSQITITGRYFPSFHWFSRQIPFGNFEINRIKNKKSYKFTQLKNRQYSRPQNQSHGPSNITEQIQKQIRGPFSYFLKSEALKINLHVHHIATQTLYGLIQIRIKCTRIGIGCVRTVFRYEVGLRKVAYGVV